VKERKIKIHNKYFLVKRPFEKLRINEHWQEIVCDPTNNFEAYVFVKTPCPNFNEVWKIFVKSRNKKELLGCSSLFYFVYYKELKSKLVNIMADEKSIVENKKKLKMFIKRYLNKWLIFIKRSDDLLYPQNQYFREIADVLKPRFSTLITEKAKIFQK
jgi:hypothetical protein